MNSRQIAAFQAESSKSRCFHQNSWCRVQDFLQIHDFATSKSQPSIENAENTMNSRQIAAFQAESSNIQLFLQNSRCRVQDFQIHDYFVLPRLFCLHQCWQQPLHPTERIPSAHGLFVYNNHENNWTTTCMIEQSTVRYHRTYIKFVALLGWLEIRGGRFTASL